MKLEIFYIRSLEDKVIIDKLEMEGEKIIINELDNNIIISDKNTQRIFTKDNEIKFKLIFK